METRSSAAPCEETDESEVLDEASAFFASGSPLGVVKLSHFADTSMRRNESCDQHCLEALHEVQAAVRRAMRRRRKTHPAASPVTHAR